MMKWVRCFTGLICKLKGHDYPCLTFNTYTLCFCWRCGKEVADRTFDDLEPFPMEEQDMLLLEEL